MDRMKEWLLTTSKDQAVHFHSFDEKGKLTQSQHQLVCRNHVEEVISPISLHALDNQVLTGH